MKKTNHRKERMTAKSMVLATVALGFCLLLSALAPTTASADWGFNMGDDGKDPKGKDIFFQKIELFIPNVPGNAGVTWSGNGVSNFSSTDRPNPSSSWNANTQKINPTYVLATGTAIRGSLFWNVLFTGTPPAEFTLDYLVYKNTNSSPPAYAIRMVIRNGVPDFTNGWTVLDLKNLPNYDRTPVVTPVPPTVFLLGAGLIGMAVLRKRVHGQDKTP